jgi:hypothetical protein
MLVQANQSLLFLLNAVSLAEKQQIPILKSLALPKAKKKICVFTVTRPTLRIEQIINRIGGVMLACSPQVQ